MSGTGQISQVCVHYLARSPCPMTPVGPAYPSNADTYYCLRCRRPSRLPFVALTRLILASHFRITALALHLPTLKPNFAVTAPRLCTDCLPGFVGVGLSPTCIVRTELAHLQRCPILRCWHCYSTMIRHCRLLSQIRLSLTWGALYLHKPINCMFVDR